MVYIKGNCKLKKINNTATHKLITCNIFDHKGD